ncbi:MAG: hypothetical protein AABX04_00715 [Nanoarchaeota archaeon]
MLKRGQITAFIILGILILAATSLFLLFNQDVPASQDLINTDSVKMYVESCLEKSAVEGMQQVFAQGGYYNFPLDTHILELPGDYFQLPYYFYSKKEILPPLSSIENEVSKAATLKFTLCVGNFTPYQKEGYDIKRGLPAVKVSFQHKTIIILNYPLNVKYGERNIEMSQFAVELPFDFLKKYTLMQNFVQEQEKDPQAFLLGKLSALAYEENDQINFEQYGNQGEDVVVDLTFNERLNNKVLSYSFALNYDWVLPEVPVNYTPSDYQLELYSPEEWNISAPGINRLQINYEGEVIKLETQPADIMISDGGKIFLNTANFTNGQYLYYIRATDVYGQTLDAPLLINIRVNPGNYPEIITYPKILLKAGELFNYTVKIAHPQFGPYTFKLREYPYTINESSGEILYSTGKKDLGLHKIWIEANNRYGSNWNIQELEVE